MFATTTNPISSGLNLGPLSLLREDVQTATAIEKWLSVALSVNDDSSHQQQKEEEALKTLVGFALASGSLSVWLRVVRYLMDAQTQGKSLSSSVWNYILPFLGVLGSHEEKNILRPLRASNLIGGNTRTLSFLMCANRYRYLSM